jgi:xanthine dehydrogenase iron-sulfur cluster and FAD-binding subunit A
MVCGASIEVLDRGQKAIFPVDERFCSVIADDIQRGSGIVTKLILPKPKETDTVVAAFFKKSRRKTFDLAVLNIALLAKMQSSIIEDIRVAIGGAEEVYVLPKAGRVFSFI